MPPRNAALPPEFDGRAFATAAASAAGVSSGRMRGRDLVRPFRGARAPAEAAEDLRALCAAFALRTAPGVIFSHQTAAQLYGLPLPYWAEEALPLHVVAIAPARPPKVARVVGHKAEPGSIGVRSMEGLSVVSPVDAWRQLATILSLDDLIAVGDGLVRRVHPPATIEELREAVSGYAGRRGAQRLRDALDAVRPRTDSRQETRLRIALTRAGLPEPEVNGSIVTEYGAFLAFGDLVYRRYRVLVEYDGGIHREDERQYHHDVDRLDAVMEIGWRVVRVNKTHMPNNAAIAIHRVRKALHDAGWRP